MKNGFSKLVQPLILKHMEANAKFISYNKNGEYNLKNKIKLLFPTSFDKNCALLKYSSFINVTHFNMLSYYRLGF